MQTTLNLNCKFNVDNFKFKFNADNFTFKL